MHDYIHAFNPSDDAVEPAEVKVLALSAEPLSEIQKVRVKIELTPFTQLPDINFIIIDDQKNIEVSSTNMIESVLDQINFVMHLRKPANEIPGNYTLTAQVIYREIGMVDEKSVQFNVV
jgi:hypothetical protein